MLHEKACHVVSVGSTAPLQPGRDCNRMYFMPRTIWRRREVFFENPDRFLTKDEKINKILLLQSLMMGGGMCGEMKNGSLLTNKYFSIH